MFETSFSRKQISWGGYSLACALASYACDSRHSLEKNLNHSGLAL